MVPTGYSFNLDGTNIYMTLCDVIPGAGHQYAVSSLGQDLAILVIAMITSKGASGVTGAGFVTLAATLSIVPDIPIQSLAISARHRQVHERMPRADQSGRQRRSHHRHEPLGERVRRKENS